jgi:hypothetical protein
MKKEKGPLVLVVVVFMVLLIFMFYVCCYGYAQLMDFNFLPLPPLSFFSLSHLPSQS